MITVIDYGSGNLRSVAKALESVGGRVTVSGAIADLRRADALLLPGVGAFGDCRRNLEAAGLIEPILEHLRRGKPFFGICVGMQLLFSESYEFGRHPGLGLIPGQVTGFRPGMVDPADKTRHLKVPHMGWNRVEQNQDHPLWQGIPDRSHFYFVHSFHGIPEEPGVVAGRCRYGLPVTAAVARDNLFATQFHPEKSQRHGLKMLQNFIGWRP